MQNFYDAVGPVRFKSDFEMNFINGELIFKTNTVFNIEWLFYMGVSSKRDDEKAYAGHYGEGFKIAALVAYRDMGLEICIESGVWRAKVGKGKKIIAGKSNEVLEYRIIEREFQENTILTLTGATQSMYELAMSLVKQFYYDGNPLFGDLIWKSEKGAIYHAKHGSQSGGVFLNLQRRGCFDFPIFFCNHLYHVDRDDRDRDYLTSSEKVDVIVDLLDEIDAYTALTILELYKTVWKSYCDRSLFRINWKKMIGKLILIISKDSEVTKIFKEKYSNELVIPYSAWWISSSRLKNAKVWFKHSDYRDRRIVGDLFDALGIKDMVTLCEENDGFYQEIDPNPDELRRIDILKRVASNYFSDLYCYDSFPICKVMLYKDSPILGQARNYDAKTSIQNSYGMRVRSTIRKIYIAKEVINQQSFADALPVFLHELLHQFGGDNSQSFHVALYEMNHKILLLRQEIFKYEKEWRKTFC